MFDNLRRQYANTSKAKNGYQHLSQLILSNVSCELRVKDPVALNAESTKRLNVYGMWTPRRMWRISWTARITNMGILRRSRIKVMLIDDTQRETKENTLDTRYGKKEYFYSDNTRVENWRKVAKGKNKDGNDNSRFQIEEIIDIAPEVEKYDFVRGLSFSKKMSPWLWWIFLE